MLWYPYHPAVAMEPAWPWHAMHLLSTMQFSPEYPEGRGFGIVMVLWWPHFWDSHPKDREYLLSITWPEICSVVKQLEVNREDFFFFN